MKRSPFGRKKLFHLVLLPLTLVLVLAFGRDSILRALGNFLVVKDELKPADAIVVLGGDDDERVAQAVTLYNKGAAHFVIMSGWTRAEGMKRKAVKSGVPVDRIWLEPEARHTYQHPGLIKPILLEHGFTSAIVVSSPYHMRRSAMLFKRVFRNSGIRLFFCPVDNSWFKPDAWWHSAQGRHEVWLEYSKMAVNVWGIRVSDVVYALVHKEKPVARLVSHQTDGTNRLSSK